MGKLSAQTPNASPVLADKLVSIQVAGPNDVLITIAALASLILPPGMTVPYGGASAPTGWLLCNGAAVSRTTYSALFAAIGTAYGVGDGSSTFNLPDLRGKVPVGKDSGTFSALGAQGGVESNNLAHAHSTDVQGYHAHTTVNEFYDGGLAANVLTQASSNTPPAHRHNTDTQGGHGHNISTSLGTTTNLQPYGVMNFIVKT